MVDRYPSSVQREALVKFVLALGCASTAFRRDECSDPRINGKHGHVYAVPGGFQLYCACETKQAWTWAKKGLAFAKPSQDGDEEGLLFMDWLPSPDEAVTIRRYLGIHAKPEVGEREVERRRQFGKRSAKCPEAGLAARLLTLLRSSAFGSVTAL
jgi:hypothetical protein